METDFFHEVSYNKVRIMQSAAIGGLIPKPGIEIVPVAIR